MYKNKSPNGSNNICGHKIKELRLQLPEKTSQRKFADMLQIQGIDVDKNAIQRIESGQRKNGKGISILYRLIFLYGASINIHCFSLKSSATASANFF